MTLAMKRVWAIIVVVILTLGGAVSIASQAQAATQEVQLSGLELKLDAGNWAFTGRSNTAGNIKAIKVISNAFNGKKIKSGNARNVIKISGKAVAHNSNSSPNYLTVNHSGNTVTLTPTAAIPVEANTQVTAQLVWDKPPVLNQVKKNMSVVAVIETPDPAPAPPTPPAPPEPKPDPGQTPPDNPDQPAPNPIQPGTGSGSTTGGASFEFDGTPGTLFISLGKGCNETGPLSGTFTLTNTADGAAQTITVTDGKGSVKNLAQGSYTLKQTSTATGYTAAAEVKYVHVDQNGNVCVSDNATGCGTAGGSGSGVVVNREFKTTNPIGQAKMTVRNIKPNVFAGNLNGQLPRGPYYRNSNDNAVSPNTGGYWRVAFDAEITERVNPGDYFYINLSEAFAVGELVAVNDVYTPALDSAGKVVAYIVADPQNPDQVTKDIAKRAKVIFTNEVFGVDSVRLKVDMPLTFDRYTAAQPGRYAAGINIGGEQQSWGEVNLIYPKLYNNTYMSIFNKSQLDGMFETISYLNANRITNTGTTTNTSQYLRRGSVNYVDITVPADSTNNTFEVYRVPAGTAMPASLAVDDGWLQRYAQKTTITPQLQSFAVYRFRLPSGTSDQFIIRTRGSVADQRGAKVNTVLALNGIIQGNVTTLLHEQPTGAIAETEKRTPTITPGIAEVVNCKTVAYDPKVKKQAITSVADLKQLGVTSNKERVFWRIDTWNNGTGILPTLKIEDTFDATRLVDFRIEKIDTHGITGLSCTSDQTVAATYELATTPTMTVNCGKYPANAKNQPQVTIIISAKVKE